MACFTVPRAIAHSAVGSRQPVPVSAPAVHRFSMMSAVQRKQGKNLHPDCRGDPMTTSTERAHRAATTGACVSESHDAIPPAPFTCLRQELPSLIPPVLRPRQARLHSAFVLLASVFCASAVLTIPLPVEGVQAVCSLPTLPCPSSFDRCIKGRCISDAKPCDPESAGVSPCSTGYSCLDGVCILDLDFSSGAIYRRCVAPSSATTSVPPPPTPVSLASNQEGGDTSGANPTNRSPSPPEPPRPWSGRSSSSPDTQPPSPLIIDPSIQDKDAAFDTTESSSPDSGGGCSPAFTCTCGVCTSDDGRREFKGYVNATTLLRDRNDLAPPLDPTKLATTTLLPLTNISALPPVAPCLLLKHLALAMNLAHWLPAGPPHSPRANATYLTLDDLTGQSCCSLAKYHGIDCGGGEDIRELILTNRNLSGVFDPYLWPRFRRLQKLSLAGNPGLVVPPADVSRMSFLRQASFANGTKFPNNAFPSWLLRVPNPSMLGVYVGNASLAGVLTLPKLPGLSPRAISAPNNPELLGVLDESADSVALDLRGSSGVCVGPFARVPGAPMDRSNVVLDSPVLVGDEALAPLAPGNSGAFAQCRAPVTGGIVGDDVVLDGETYYTTCSLQTVLLTVYWRELIAPVTVLCLWLCGVLWCMWSSRVGYPTNDVVNMEPNCRVFSSPFALLTLLSIVLELQFSAILLTSPHLYPTPTNSVTSSPSFTATADSTSTTIAQNSSTTLVSTTLLAILKLVTLITVIIPRLCNAYYTFRLPGLWVLLRVFSVLDIWHFLHHFRTRAVKHSPSRTYVPPHLWSLAMLQLVLKEAAQVAVSVWAWAIAKRTTVTTILMMGVAVVGVLKEMGLRVRWAWPLASVHDDHPPELIQVQPRRRTQAGGVYSPNASTFPVEDETAETRSRNRHRHPWARISRLFGRHRSIAGQRPHQQHAASQTTAAHVGPLDSSGVPLQFQVLPQRSSPSPAVDAAHAAAEPASLSPSLTPPVAQSP